VSHPESPASFASDHDELISLIREERDQLIKNWRRDARVLASAAHLDEPTLDDHIPAFLDELIMELSRPDETRVAELHTAGSPTHHGLQRLQDGFDITEVVAEYNIIRDALQDLVETHGLVLHGVPARTINRVLDKAIGIAVRSYASQKAVELQQRREEHLAFIVHDLRTPLNAISLVTDELEHSLPGPMGEGTEELVGMLKRNLGRLDRLVTCVSQEQVNLMATGRRKLERRDIDLLPFVKSIVRDMRPLQEAAGTKISTQIAKDHVVSADALLLSQIFQNLISNALRFTQGGQVIVGARFLGTTTECWVQDNGSGVAADRVDLIFEKLETDLDPEKRSTGLGLAIVKEAVEAHDGSVSVEILEPHGTAFRFTLPSP